MSQPDSYYAERIDDLITVFISRQSGEPVGALIKNVGTFVKEVLESTPGFQAEIRGEGIQLEYLLTAGLWRKQKAEKGHNGNAIELYLRLREIAGEDNARVALQAC
ncbi:MAG: hypothetical protein WD030_04360 [Pirellulales bacterium]